MEHCHCPACGDAFRGSLSSSAPLIFPCGHSVCPPCAEAVLGCPEPVCPICADPAPAALPNPALAAFAELMYTENVGDASEAAAVAPAAVTVTLDSEGAPELPHLVAECASGADALAHASEVLEALARDTEERCAASCAAFEAAMNNFAAAVLAYKTEQVAAARALCRSRVKALQSQADSVGVSASQLRAYAALGASALAGAGIPPPVAHAALSRAVLLAAAPTQSCVEGVVELVPCVGDVDARLASLAYTRTELHASVSGPGLLSYRKGADNAFTVVVKDERGVAASSLSPAAVEVCSAPHGLSAFTVTSSGPGEFAVAYAVSASQTSAPLALTVVVCGRSVATVTVPTGCFGEGYHDYTIRISEGAGNSGLAVSPQGDIIAVANETHNNITLYDLTGRVVRVMGGRGTAPGLLAAPHKVCFTPAGNILVAEMDNRRAQEFTRDGVHVSFFGVGVIDDGVVSVATNGEEVLVGKGMNDSHNRIYRFAYPSGALLGTIDNGMRSCWGLHFISHDAFTVAEYMRARVNVVTLEGEELSKVIGGLIQSPRDAVRLANGNLLIPNRERDELVVVAPDGSLVTKINTKLSDPKVFIRSPVALAIHANQVFVLNQTHASVEVFH